MAENVIKSRNKPSEIPPFQWRRFIGPYGLCLLCCNDDIMYIYTTTAANHWHQQSLAYMPASPLRTVIGCRGPVDGRDIIAASPLEVWSLGSADLFVHYTTSFSITYLSLNLVSTPWHSPGTLISLSGHHCSLPCWWPDIYIYFNMHFFSCEILCSWGDACLCYFLDCYWWLTCSLNCYCKLLYRG